MHESLVRICTGYYNDIYRYTLYLCRDSEMAKDLTQETFLKALKSLHTLKDESKVKTWLFSIARNHYVDHFKRKKLELSDDILPELVDTKGLTPEQQYLARENDERVQNILLTLDEEDRRIFDLRVNQKLSYDEIAEMMNMNTNTLRVKFHRIRIKLIGLIRKEVDKDE